MPRPFASGCWINWDSGFRESDFKIEDRIVAMNGVALTLPEEPKGATLHPVRWGKGLCSRILRLAGVESWHDWRRRSDGMSPNEYRLCDITSPS